MSQLISQQSGGLQIRSQGEPVGFVLSLLRSMRRAWTTHADRKLLAELSDYQLRDIGIRREHIPRVVRHGWDI